MQVISFKHTILFKRGMWLSAAALVASVTIPWILDGSFRQEPVIHVIPVCIVGGFWVYFLWRMQIHRIADEVTDCEDYLKVRKGETEEVIPFSNIAMAVVSTSGGIHRITVRLHEPTRLSTRIVFLPQASLWSNLPGVMGVAAGLTDRANKGKDGRVVHSL
jgi:hypothetical protein